MTATINGIEQTKIAQGLAAMTATEKKLAKADVSASKIAKNTRQALLDLFISHDRTVACSYAPKKGEAESPFYNDLIKISAAAVGAKTSNIGHPDGESYPISVILDSPIKSLPAWTTSATIPSGVKMITLRQYWQSQKGAWLSDMRLSWIARENTEKLLKGGAQAVTAAWNDLNLKDLNRVKARFGKAEEANFSITRATKLLDELIEMIPASTVETDSE